MRRWMIRGGGQVRREERRPFFVEGSEMFETPIQLFYSRRIGRNPGYFSIPDGYKEVDNNGTHIFLIKLNYWMGL